jgi:hypothetical protein
MTRVAHRALLLAFALGACARAQAPQGGRPNASSEMRAPVVSRGDTAWADVGRPCGPAEPVWSPPLDSAARRLEHGRDARWAAIAREVPGGFAGFYAEDGRLVVLLTDTLQKDAALRALAPLRQRSHLDLANARVAPARWDFAQLHDWWAYIASRRVRFVGATMFDIDERDNRLTYGFESSAALRRAERQLKPLGLPCYLVAFVIQPPVQLR